MQLQLATARDLVVDKLYEVSRQAAPNAGAQLAEVARHGRDAEMLKGRGALIAGFPAVFAFGGQRGPEARTAGTGWNVGALACALAPL